MVDDLVTRGVTEPYRMFTSRAEYRLMLREDNAALRLTEIGRELGVVEDERWRAYCEKKEAIERESERRKSTWVIPRLSSAAEIERVLGKPIEREYSFYELLRRPDVNYAALMSLEDGAGVAPEVASQVEIQAKYHGYIERQEAEIARRMEYEELRLPMDFDYATVKGLSSETRQILNRHRPETIGQAARLSGITPAAVSLLLVHQKRGFSGA
jgi:tRNA uridine 5-carboxymethylaminomethyl modification enzyme